jgi:hypothetical protein
VFTQSKSGTVFADRDLDQIVFDASASHAMHTILITIIGYVQTKIGQKTAMVNWIKYANWKSVKCCPCGVFVGYEFMV